MKSSIKYRFLCIQNFSGVILCMLFYLALGCENSNTTGGADENEIITPPEEQNELYICAKVENASKYSNIVAVKLMGVDRSIEKDVELARFDFKDGGFTIVFPKTLSSKYLHAFINNNGLPVTIINTPSTMSISNKNIKVENANFWGVDNDGNLVTHFFPFKIDNDGNAISAFFTYVDSDVTISGYGETEVAITEYEEADNAYVWYVWKKTTTYSIEWKEGWNVWCLSSFQSVQERTITEKWTSIPSSILKWYGGEDLWSLNRN